MKRTAMFMALALMLLAASLAASGCTPTLPTEPAGIDGIVTILVPGDARPSQFVVSGGTLQAGAVSDRAQVGIEPSTQFFGPDGKPGKAAEIAEGSRVKVWFTGPVAETNPVQGTARVVQLVRK